MSVTCAASLVESPDGISFTMAAPANLGQWLFPSGIGSNDDGCALGSHATTPGLLRPARASGLASVCTETCSRSAGGSAEKYSRFSACCAGRDHVGHPGSGLVNFPDWLDVDELPWQVSVGALAGAAPRCVAQLELVARQARSGAF
jgi:hypothetical protein